jgi:hypothetical protein
VCVLCDARHHTHCSRSQCYPTRGERGGDTRPCSPTPPRTAQSVPKNTPARPRNTDPNVPRYKLSEATSSLPPQPATTHRAVLDHVQKCMFPGDDGGDPSTAAPPADPTLMRSLATADINTATRALPPRPASPPGSVERPVGSLAVADIEGSAVGWKPTHRAHVGVGNPPDKLACADINDYMLPKSYKTLFKGEQTARAQRPRPATAGATRRSDTAAAPGLPPGFAFTGLPCFQGPPPSAEAWDAARTARVGASPAEEEAAAVSHAVQEQLARTHARLDHAKFLQQLHNDVAIGHRIRVELADAKDAAKAAANAAVASLSVSRSDMGVLWKAMLDIDRTRSGRLTPGELSQAFERAGVARSTQQMADLATGLADHAGLLPYKELARVLIAKAQVPGSSPTLFANLRPAAAPRARPASAHPAGRSMSIGGGAAAPSSSARVPLPRPPRQDSTRPLSAAAPVPVDAAPVFADAGAPAAQPSPDERAAPAGASEPTATTSGEPHACGGDDGPVYHPWKGKAYWFGGASDPAEIEQQAAEWMPMKDPVAGPSPQVGDAIAAARSPPAYLAPTASSRLKAGELAPHELASQLAGSIRPSSAQRSRPSSARSSRPPASTQQGGVMAAWQQQQQQQALIVAAASGTTAGNMLRGTTAPVGTGALGLGAPHAREESTCTRAISARSHAPAGAGARPGSAHARHVHNGSFSSVALKQGGHAMDAMVRAMVKSDVQAVRRLI